MVEISVIVPVYNASPFLERCINSILTQDFKKFELILIDDGSTDESGYICDEYARSDDRVKVIHKKNQGVSAARNTGIDVALGKYIMFCDADDWVRNDWMKTLWNVIIENSSAWIVSGIEYIENGEHIYRRPFGERNDLVKERISEFYLIYKACLDGYCFNKIYCREIIETQRIRFDSNVVFGEDVEFNLNYLKYMKNIIGISSTPYFYNADNLESATRKFDVNRFEKHCYVFNLRKRFIAPKYMKQFANDFYGICRWDIQCLYDKRNTWNMLKKIKYSNYILQSTEFQECLRLGAGEAMHKVYLEALKSGRYVYVYLLDRLRLILNKLR